MESMTWTQDDITRMAILISMIPASMLLSRRKNRSSANGDVSPRQKDDMKKALRLWKNFLHSEGLFK